MKDRIRKFMDHVGLTAAELADIIGVQRSNVSHILNGRNKPGAVFIEKLLIEYPDLNARWLFIGAGDMMNTKKSERNLFTPPEIQGNESEIKPVETSEKGLPEVTEAQAENTEIYTDNKVEKIVVFYSNKTFREYNPE